MKPPDRPCYPSTQDHRSETKKGNTIAHVRLSQPDQETLVIVPNKLAAWMFIIATTLPMMWFVLIQGGNAPWPWVVLASLVMLPYALLYSSARARGNVVLYQNDHPSTHQPIGFFGNHGHTYGFPISQITSVQMTTHRVSINYGGIAFACLELNSNNPDHPTLKIKTALAPSKLHKIPMIPEAERIAAFIGVPVTYKGEFIEKRIDYHNYNEGPLRRRGRGYDSW